MATATEILGLEKRREQADVIWELIIAKAQVPSDAFGLAELVELYSLLIRD